jgi:HlyD family secretion protein
MKGARMKRAIVWGVIGLAVAGLVVYAVRPRPVPVESAAVTRGVMTVALTEEAKTRLDRTYVVSMPVAGRLFRVHLIEGDQVDSGAVVARIDTFDRAERLKTLEAQVREIEAQMLGVDKAKPKPEDFAAAELAVAESRLRLAAAHKALEEVRITYCEQEKQYLRTQRLFDDRTVSQSEMDEEQRKYLVLRASHEQAQLNADVAAKTVEANEVKLKRLHASVDDNEYQRAAFQAQIRRLQAEQALVRDELAQSLIRAPVAGPVLSLQNEDQRVLVAGAAILTLGDLDSLRVESDILSEEIRRLHVGQPVEIRGPAAGAAPVLGRIERIFPAGFDKVSSLGIEQQRVKVIVAFDNSQACLRPGVRVDVRIITDRKENALLVPERALFKVHNAWHVFATRDGRARLTPVSIGLRNDEFAEVLDGLREGDRVIPSPPADLQDGARVAAAPR